MVGMFVARYVLLYYVAQNRERDLREGILMPVSHYRGSPADPLGNPLELEQKLGES